MNRWPRRRTTKSDSVSTIGATSGDAVLSLTTAAGVQQKALQQIEPHVAQAWVDVTAFSGIGMPGRHRGEAQGACAATSDQSPAKTMTKERDRYADFIRWICCSIAALLFLLAQFPEALAQAPRLPKVYAAHGHGLIVLPSGVVKVFGRNEHGELGLGSMGDPQYSNELIDLPGVYDAVDGAVGGDSSYVLRADGTVLAWGENHEGQLGLGTPGVLPKVWDIIQAVPAPTPVPGLTGVRQLATHGAFVVALREDGTVKAWGLCGQWKLDEVPAGSRATDRDYRVPFPVTITGLSGVKAVSAGGGYALALMNDGTVKAWGSNKHGYLGDEVIDFSATPISIAGLNNVVAVSATDDYALALLRDGTVRVWGNGGSESNLYNFAGTRDPSIHLGAYSWSAKPFAIPRLRDVVAISAGATAIALLTNGTARGWGWDGYCSMGLGRCFEIRNSVHALRVSSIAAIASGNNVSYFVRRDGAVMAAGSHRFRELFRVPTVILSAEQAAQPAPPADKRVGLPVTSGEPKDK